MSKFQLVVVIVMVLRVVMVLMVVMIMMMMKVMMVMMVMAMMVVMIVKVMMVVVAILTRGVKVPAHVRPISGVQESQSREGNLLNIHLKGGVGGKLDHLISFDPRLFFLFRGWRGRERKEKSKKKRKKDHKLFSFNMVIGQLSYGIMEYVPNEQTTKKGTPMDRRKYIQAAADIIHSIHMIHILLL